MTTIGFEENFDVEKETAELKRELEEYLLVIKKGNLDLDQIYCAQRALSLVRGILQMRNLEVAQSRLTDVPSGFLCPISGEIMDEPVYFCTNVACDRSSILECVNDISKTCDQSEVVLSSFRLTPDEQLSKCIAEWCNYSFESMLKGLSSSSLTDMKAAAKEIRKLTEHSENTQAVLGEKSMDIINILLKEVSGKAIGKHLDLQEDLIATLFNLSLDDRYKKIFRETSTVAHLLVRFLSCGTFVSKRKALETMSSILTDDSNLQEYKTSAEFKGTDDSNLQEYGTSGAFIVLAEILKEKDNFGARDAATNMWKLCYQCSINRKCAVEDGVIGIIMEVLPEISDHVVFGKLLAVILMLLDAYPDVVEQLGWNEGAHVLHNILKKEGITEEIKELCIIILRRQCEFDS